MCHPEEPLGPSPTVDEIDWPVELDNGESMPATLFSVGGPGPGVVLVSDIHGPGPFYRALAARLAAAGFSVVLPDIFFRQGPADGPDLDSALSRRSRLDEARTLVDLDTTAAQLASRLGRDRIGSLGFCMGGTFVLDLASTRTDMVTVAYYGFPVPPASVTKPPPRPIDLADQLAGPVLAYWGEEDRGVGLENIRAYVDLAARSNPQFQHEILPGLGHAFLARADLDDPQDRGGATWRRTLRHFTEHLA